MVRVATPLRHPRQRRCIIPGNAAASPPATPLRHPRQRCCVIPGNAAASPPATLQRHPRQRRSLAPSNAAASPPTMQNPPSQSCFTVFQRVSSCFIMFRHASSCFIMFHRVSSRFIVSLNLIIMFSVRAPVAVSASACSVVRMPEKLTVYTTLVGLLNARQYNIGGEASDPLCDPAAPVGGERTNGLTLVTVV